MDQEISKRSFITNNRPSGDEADRHDLPPAGAFSGAMNAGSQASEGMSQAITVLALYPILKLFRLLSKLTSRAVIANEANAGSNSIAQESNKADYRRKTFTDGPSASMSHKSPSARLLDLTNETEPTRAKGQISIDASFEGVDPSSPSPVGKHGASRRQVT